MSAELIERMARAAWEENRRQIEAEGIDTPPWDRATLDVKQRWRANTRAALVAAREPTDEMIEAAALRTGRARFNWRRMVDRATGEPT